MKPEGFLILILFIVVFLCLLALVYTAATFFVFNSIESASTTTLTSTTTSTPTRPTSTTTTTTPTVGVVASLASESELGSTNITVYSNGSVVELKENAGGVSKKEAVVEDSVLGELKTVISDKEVLELEDAYACDKDCPADAESKSLIVYVDGKPKTVLLREPRSLPPKLSKIIENIESMRGLFGDVECAVDADCVPAACCHAVECVSAGDAPDCSNTMCTMDCAPGTMDCGGGMCVCDNGECAVEWT